MSMTLGIMHHGAKLFSVSGRIKLCKLSASKIQWAMQETQELWVQPLSQEDYLEEGIETCSSILI